MDLSKRKAYYLQSLRDFYKKTQEIDRESLLRLQQECKETSRRLSLIVEQTETGMKVAKEAFDELQKREEQRLEEKKLSLDHAKTKLKVLDLLVSRKKIPAELQKSLEE